MILYIITADMCSNLEPDFSQKLKKFFFTRNPELVAKELLGKILILKNSSEEIFGVRITETEAYLAENDLASHSYAGITKRNAAMFEDGGILYVYKIYGIHFCANIVTEYKGRGSAVLIRAGEPLIGENYMLRNRGLLTPRKLCIGPGNFAKALGINLDFNFKSLESETFFLQNGYLKSNETVFSSSRIGITKSQDLLLRFYLA